MILRCECCNTTADAIYGKGRRPHIKLKAHPLLRQLDEYLCEFCDYVRTLARGRRTGKKSDTAKA